ncbi:SdrD B-like domain-containing protein, partial [Peptoniphilus harei]|uniref:SdrD B-like domain-containing protein n=1 Tax=Peptoniphilus harei TaxID=54005 RepID=UPI00290E1D9B
MIVGVFATDKLSVFAEINDKDFDVNTDWRMSNDITTEFSVPDGVRAYSTGKAKVGNIGVTTKFVKQADRNDGASYLSGNGKHQADYAATSDMFYANPDPSTIPALAINAQASNGVGGKLNTYQKANYSGRAEVGTVTLTFDKTVTDPVLDLSGLGGYVNAFGDFQYSNGTGAVLGRGSFNSTDIELITDGVSFEKGASNSNLEVTNNTIKVKNRNTFTHAKLTQGEHIQNNGYPSPKLVPAGTGSVILKGTFKEVSLKLYHNATPYSAFPTDKYGTSRVFFTNNNNSQYGDGINGLNVINTEKIQIGNKTYNNLTNWDKFRISLRLLKPSSIGDRVWLDEDANGIQDAGEKGVEGVTVKLLDKDGSPAKDFNGNLVQDQVTDANGNYKFENLPAGEYVVQVVTKDGQTLTTKGQGAADKDSDLDPKTGKTDVIKLEANENIPNVDAGIVPAKEYKVDYEFQPSKAEGTPEKLPEEVLKQLPEAKEKLKDGSEVPSPKEFTPVKDEVNKGTWTFEAWDKETAKIDGKDEHVKGTWKFTPDPAKETGNVYVKYVTEDGEVLEAESIVKKDAEVGEAYTTEQKTFDGYEFVKLEDGSAPKDGKVEKGDQHVTYVYKKVKTPDPAKETGNVYVKYVDDKGNVLEEQSVVKKDAPVGEDYTT